MKREPDEQAMMHRSMPQSTPRAGGHRTPVRPCPGFTLIEVLAVVAIIALLIAILMPSLKAARQESRKAVCLSNLKQQGIALAAYSVDYRGLLPWTGSFRFSLMEGEYYLYADPNWPTRHNWTRVNTGVLYPKYVASMAEVFYCPSNKAADIAGPNGVKTLIRCYRNPKRGDPQYIDAHNFPISPYTSYAYAVPAVEGVSPRDAGDKMYPPEVVRYENPITGQTKGDSPYWHYLNDAAEPAPAFLGRFPQESRGKHPVHALMSDGFFKDDYEGYHLGGYNVLFGDFHARWIRDPGGKIRAARLNPIRPTRYSGMKDAGTYVVWDFFSRQP